MGQILLAAHADIEARDNEGETPLALAARSGRSDVFEWLVQHGANLDAPGRDGKTPRWIAAHTPGNPNPFRSVETDATSAAMWGRLDALQALLRGDPHLMYQTNWFGTPLRGAAMEHRTNVVDFLDHAGVRWDAVSAVLTGHDGKLREVLAATPAACNDRFYGSSLLHLAAAAGDVGCAAVLLEHHCDVAAQDPRGLSPLGVARLRQAREIVILLRLPGAQENVFDTIYCDDLPQLKRLLGRNRSLALATNQAGFATVEVAAGLGHPRLLERLFRAGCSAQFVNASSGRTPLHTAAFFNQTNTVGLLLKRGARTEAMDRWGFTPLHLAALNGAMDAGRLLLAWKVNPDMRGVPLAVLPTAPPDFYRHSALRGDTALHLAAIAGKPEFVRLLLLSGANVNATDFAGHTPLYLVRRTGGFEAVVQGMYRDFEVMSGRFKDGLPGSLLDTRSIWAGQSAVAQLLQDSGAKLSPVVGR
jgi:ankyrin repeat protein